MTLQCRSGLGAECAGGVQEGLRRFLRARFGAHQRLEAERRQAGLFALLQLLGGEGRVVVFLQRLKQRVCGVEGLHPHLALRR